MHAHGKNVEPAFRLLSRCLTKERKDLQRT